jgi:hypothetical protein
MRFSKSFLTTLATGAMAMPFGLLAIHSGTNIQYASINANHLTLAIGLPTTTFTQSNVNPSLFTNTTLFNLLSGGAIIMNAESPGFQYLYVWPKTGRALITPPHTDIPVGGISNFTIISPNLQFENGTIGALACGPKDGPYHIFFNFPGLNTSHCRGIGLYVAYQRTYGAWEYD